MFSYSWLLKIYFLTNTVSHFQFTIDQLIGVGYQKMKEGLYMKEIKCIGVRS